MRYWIICAALFLATPAWAQPSTVGPTASIECPMGATDLGTSDDIPAIVWAASNGTAFCVLAGTHTPTEPINLREGQSLTGEYGAIINCASVVQGFDLPSTSCVRGWGCSASCSNVTIRNLVIRDLAAYNCVGIVGSGEAADDWVIDRNEISGCTYGVNVGFNDDTTVSGNYIHNNGSNPPNHGGYGGNETTDLVFEDNYFANNGNTQKVSITDRTIFRRNRFLNDIVWYDGDNTNGLIEDNLFNGCSGESGIAIHYEISAQAVIRRNRIDYCPGTAIFISTSHTIEVYDNITVGANYGLNAYVDCDAVGGGVVVWDTHHVHFYDNRVYVDAGHLRGAVFTPAGSCDSMEDDPYLDGSKDITFENNDYYVMDVGGNYWEWGADIQSFATWQAGGRDDTGAVSPFLGTRLRLRLK